MSSLPVPPSSSRRLGHAVGVPSSCTGIWGLNCHLGEARCAALRFLGVRVGAMAVLSAGIHILDQAAREGGQPDALGGAAADAQPVAGRDAQRFAHGLAQRLGPQQR